MSDDHDQPRSQDSFGETESGRETDWFGAGDAIAAEILRDLQPLRFGEVLDERHREECFRLRFQAVAERGLAATENFSDGMERDELDEDAVQIAGWDETRLVATCRLVLPSPGRPLPTEAVFGLRLPADDSALEMGRVVVDPDYRGDGHSLLMGLVAQCWLSMRTRGYSTAIGATTRRLIALLEALGFPVEVLGPPRTYWGEERYPIFCGGRPAVSELKGEWLIPEVHNLPPDGKTGADPPKEPGETA